MTGRALYFTEPHAVEAREMPVPDPGPEDVRVQVQQSGISPGTELRVYRGEFTPGTETDETIAALEESFSYPLQYGYTAVGKVTAAGEDVTDDWLGQQVFAFQPHASHFLADPETLIPTKLPPEQALFIPNAEAATNFVMDARPRVGARAVVFGQGPVGLLTTKLLAEFPLSELVTVDRYENRRQLSESFGADRSVAPGETAEALTDDADIAFELSGNPAALDSAIDVTGFAGQVIVGSWYGSDEVALTLDESYHRSHVRIRSSQVSRLDPDHTDRWDKDRRMDVVQSWLGDADLDGLLTHRFDIAEASAAYRLLEERRDEAIQVAFDYR